MALPYQPNAVLPVRVNKQVISPSIQSTVLAFTFLYAIIAIISILVMMGFGVGFLESIGTVISSIGNMGPGLGTCGRSEERRVGKECRL